MILALLFLSAVALAAPGSQALDLGPSTGQWRGTEAIEMDGVPALRWRFADSTSLTLDSPPADWSAYGALALRIRPNQTSEQPLYVLIYQEDPGSEGIDYWIYTQRLDFEGWRDILIPFDEMGRARTPLGWGSVTGFVLHNAWAKDSEPDRAIELDVADVRLVPLATTGPRLTEEAFFADFDYTAPGIEAVRDAVAASDYAVAREAFTEHLRNRETPRWFTDWRQRPAEPVSQPDTTEADRALAHQYLWLGTVYDLGPDIDWSSNQTWDKGEIATLEWNASLNRHFHFKALQRAYWDTGDAKYANEIVAQWIDWIEDCPVLLTLSGNGPYHHAWETLNTAIRAGDTWPQAFFCCLDAPAMTPDTVVTICRSLVEHARHLDAWPSKSNWLTMESRGLFTIGLLLREHKDAATWRAHAIERLSAQLDQEVYPDGLQWELALGYNNWVLRNFADIFELAKLNGAGSELPGDYISRLESMYDYQTYAVSPEWTVPALNDAGPADPAQLLRTGLTYFPHREDFRFVATHGAEGQPPAKTSVAFPYSGHYVMRSDWSKQANYLLFDAGTFGAGHQHEDKLHFTLYGCGKLLLAEGGSYMYDKSRWRRYVLSTRAHNTVLVDGLEQNRRHARNRDTRTLTYPFEPLPNAWESTEQFDFVQGEYRNGYGPDLLDAVHARSILFVKPEYWIVIDTLEPADGQNHECAALFHFAQDDAVLDEGSLRVDSAGPEAGLALWARSAAPVQIGIVKGTEEEPVQGWANYPWRPVPTAVVSVAGAGPIIAAYVLCPYRENTEPFVRSVARADAPSANTLELTIETAAGTDHATYTPSPRETRAPEAAAGTLMFTRTASDGSAALTFRFDAGHGAGDATEK